MHSLKDDRLLFAGRQYYRKRGLKKDKNKQNNEKICPRRWKELIGVADRFFQRAVVPSTHTRYKSLGRFLIDRHCTSSYNRFVYRKRRPITRVDPEHRRQQAARLVGSFFSLIFMMIFFIFLLLVIIVSHYYNILRTHNSPFRFVIRSSTIDPQFDPAEIRPGWINSD